MPPYLHAESRLALAAKVSQGAFMASLMASLIACIPNCLPNCHPHCMQVLTDCHEPRLVGFTLGSVLAAHASVGRHVLMIQSLGERLHV